VIIKSKGPNGRKSPAPKKKPGAKAEGDAAGEGEQEEDGTKDEVVSLLRQMAEGIKSCNTKLDDQMKILQKDPQQDEGSNAPKEDEEEGEPKGAPGASTEGAAPVTETPAENADLKSIKDSLAGLTKTVGDMAGIVGALAEKVFPKAS
jgi:hypothetical protein